MNSKAQAVYSNVYNIPVEIGPMDVQFGSARAKAGLCCTVAAHGARTGFSQ